MAESCFHCGADLPPDVSYSVTVNAAQHRVCCAGCEAAATLIVSQGLERFYQFREGAGAAARFDGPPDWSVFDREAALRRYTHLNADGHREASLDIAHVHCAACAWLIENSLCRLDGVSGVHVNAGTSHAELRYDPTRVSFSRVLAGIATLGYLPRPLSFTGDEAGWSAERRTALQRLAVAGFGMMTVMTYAISLYAGAMEGIDAATERFLRFVSLLVTTPVVLYAAQPFFAAAWRSVRARTLGMDVPVALGIGAAYAWSVGATLLGRGEVYFDSAVMFTFFLLLGRYVEMSLRHRSGRHGDALVRLLPDGVTRLDGAREQRVTPDELLAGDRVRIRPGERVPADGEIVTGMTEVDESLLTGESAPRARGRGDQIIAGTLNLSGAVEVRVLRAGQDSTLATVSRLLERAQASRPLTATLADRVAAWFVAGVLLLSLLVLLYWLRADATRAFPIVLAVLVVTCPCALSLATPAVLAAATTRLARLGLLVTRSRAIETLARADRIVLDKTGTLTRGTPRLDELCMLDASMDRATCLAIAAALERHSEHPIARAFRDCAPTVAVDDVVIAPGRGLEGRVGGRRYRIGRAEYVQEFVGDPGRPPAASDHEARTTVWLADDSKQIAVFHFSDALREDARATIERLRALRLDPSIASGDRDAVVAAIAARLGGVPARAGVSAKDKLAIVRGLQAEGRIVAMVGDGVNDAPVLAGADVSIAVGSGTDLAKVSADFIMMGERLAPLLEGVEISRRARRVIRENLGWAIVYNATAVPLAAAGALTPWMAALGMSISSLLVVLNATRLLRDGRNAASPAPAKRELVRA